MNKLTIFLDTMMYLHYQRFDQIDWAAVTRADSVFIIVPQVILREIDNHKETHHLKRIRERAASILALMDKLSEGGPSAELRPNVALLFEDQEPQLDFSRQRLSPDCPDDHLLASILEYRTLHPEKDVVLATRDPGLKVKARGRGLKTFALDDSLRLPEEPDPNETRIKELIQRTRELESRVPLLKLCFDGGAQHREFALSRPAKISEEQVRIRMAEVKQRFHPKQVPPPEDPAKIGQLPHSELMRRMVESIPPEEVLRYNSELEKFHADCARFLKERSAYDEVMSRTIDLKLFLLNDGTSPAEDIDVFLRFPANVTVLPEDRKPEAPAQPKPPRPPRPWAQRMVEMVVASREQTQNLADAMAEARGHGNVSPPEITKTKSFEVKYHIERLKHKLSETLSPVTLIFDSFEEASTFQIECRINSASMPHEANGKLTVIVSKDA